MKEAIRDLKHRCRFEPGMTVEDILATAATVFLVQGVKIGGRYLHWKGMIYEVTGVRRDAEKWTQWLVDYQDVHNSEHKASRKLEEFLGDNNDERFIGPRFRLVG